MFIFFLYTITTHDTSYLSYFIIGDLMHKQLLSAMKYIPLNRNSCVINFLWPFLVRLITFSFSTIDSYSNRSRSLSYPLTTLTSALTHPPPSIFYSVLFPSLRRVVPEIYGTFLRLPIREVKIYLKSRRNVSVKSHLRTPTFRTERWETHWNNYLRFQYLISRKSLRSKFLLPPGIQF